MGKCKLYLRLSGYRMHLDRDVYIGEFANKEAAEKYHTAIKEEIQHKYGYDVKSQPVYVEQKKGKGK